MKRSLILCDLTQSYAASGGGIRTYLTEKRAFIEHHTAHRHLLIVPGAEDRVINQGRHITVEIASPRVPASPNYRLLLRSGAVLKALRQFDPATIECLCAYNLPWTAVFHRRKSPNTKLIAGYRTDFPTVYIERYGLKMFGNWVAQRAKRIAYAYTGKLYRKFDAAYALNDETARKLDSLGVAGTETLPLGIDPEIFNPDKRDDGWRASIGAAPDHPVLVYAGRIDEEKRADMLIEAFAKLPESMNAHLVLLGEGHQKEELEQQMRGKRVHFPGFVSDRSEIGRILASSDIYVSAMAFETFGISIIEAQAAGLPVVGVNAGAMPHRVSAELGILGPVGDADTMAANITQLWQSGEAPAMGMRARQHAVSNFCWQRTFEHLFGHIYAKATGMNLLLDTTEEDVTIPSDPAFAPELQPSFKPAIRSA